MYSLRKAGPAQRSGIPNLKTAPKRVPPGPPGQPVVFRWPTRVTNCEIHNTQPQADNTVVALVGRYTQMPAATAPASHKPRLWEHSGPWQWLVCPPCCTSNQPYTPRHETFTQHYIRRSNRHLVGSSVASQAVQWSYSSDDMSGKTQLPALAVAAATARPRPRPRRPL